MNYKLFIKITGWIVCVASLGLEGYMLWMAIRMNFTFIPGIILGVVTFVAGIGMTFIPRLFVEETHQEVEVHKIKSYKKCG